MITAIRPAKGGYLLPFGCGEFVRDFLMGKGPFGAPAIDPDKGACQEDIFYHYKMALFRFYAEDAVAREEEERIRRKMPPYTAEEAEARTHYHLERIPYKLHRARYHSFQRYFHWLKQLEWVEFTGEDEASSIEPYYPDAPKRRYYRLTRKGIDAPDYEWSRPQLVLYPEINGRPGLEYFREKRKEHHYSSKPPVRKRVKV